MVVGFSSPAQALLIWLKKKASKKKPETTYLVPFIHTPEVSAKNCQQKISYRNLSFVKYYL
jgi:hypothetical protein